MPTFVLRIMFQPTNGTLWAYNRPTLNQTYFKEIINQDGCVEKNNFIETQFQRDKDEDEENDVDLQRAMWLIVRKKRSINMVLKDFFPDYQAHMLRVRDIIKFGRVNFKISVIDSDSIDAQYAGSCYNPISTNRNLYDAVEQERARLEAVAKSMQAQQAETAQMA